MTLDQLIRILREAKAEHRANGTTPVYLSRRGQDRHEPQAIIAPDGAVILMVDDS